MCDFMEFIKKSNLFFALSIFIWLTLFSFMFFSYFGSLALGHHFFYLIANNISSILELILDILIIIISWFIYKREEKNFSKYFLFLFLSLFANFFNDFNFVVIFDLLKIQSPTNYYNLFYLLPFLVYLIFQLLFWFGLVSNFILKDANKFWVLLVLLAFGVVVIFLFITTSRWNISYVSYIGIYEILTGVLEVVVFNLAALSLICSKNKGLYYVSFATLLMIATNFWEKYLFQAGILGSFDYSDIFWFLSLLLMLFGLIYLLKAESIKISNWVRSLRSIKSQTALWSFGFAVTGFIVLFLAGYYCDLISKDSLVSLPFLIMIYSVAIILISNYAGGKLEIPFRKLQKNIELFMDPQSNKFLLKSNFFTEEFIFLQKFIFNLYEMQEERNKEKKSIAELSLQMAHDIRSPVAAILMLSKECLNLPETQRVSLRDAANRIQDIANNLLSQYGRGASTDNFVEILLVSHSVLSVIAEKKLQYKALGISFLYNVDQTTNFVFIKINRVEFERTLSNLINNAVEALKDNGCVRIEVCEEGGVLVIAIIDNGSGMQKHVLTEIMSKNKIISHKRNGYGLGLTYVRTVLQKYNADFNIQSEINKGTKIELRFKCEKCPSWIPQSIDFHDDDLVVILDDDSFIHHAWDELFYKKCKNLQIVHFNIAEDCVIHIQSLSSTDRNKILLLADYELINQYINGLDVIEVTGIKRSILVTSHYEYVEVIKRAILLKVQLLPKVLISDVHINICKKPNFLAENFDLLLVDDSQELCDILSYLYLSKGKKLKICNNPYDMFNVLEECDKKIEICLDYDLGLPINGVDLAKVLWEKGYKKLYLATGYNLRQDDDFPPYLTVLEDKMALLNL